MVLRGRGEGRGRGGRGHSHRNLASEDREHELTAADKLEALGLEPPEPIVVQVEGTGVTATKLTKESVVDRDKRKEQNRQLRKRFAEDPSSLTEEERTRVLALLAVLAATQQARATQQQQPSTQPSGLESVPTAVVEASLPQTRRKSRETSTAVANDTHTTDIETKAMSGKKRKKIEAEAAEALVVKKRQKDSQVREPVGGQMHGQHPESVKREWKEQASKEDIKRNTLLRQRFATKPESLTEEERERASALVARDERKKAKKLAQKELNMVTWEERTGWKDRRREYAKEHGAVENKKGRGQPENKAHGKGSSKGKQNGKSRFDGRGRAAGSGST